MELFEAIAKRHSYRGAFLAKPVPREDLGPRRSRGRPGGPAPAHPPPGAGPPPGRRRPGRGEGASRALSGIGRSGGARSVRPHCQSTSATTSTTTWRVTMSSQPAASVAVVVTTYVPHWSYRWTPAGPLSGPLPSPKSVADVRLSE